MLKKIMQMHCYVNAFALSWWLGLPSCAQRPQRRASCRPFFRFPTCLFAGLECRFPARKSESGKFPIGQMRSLGRRGKNPL